MKSSSALTAAKTVTRWLRWAAVLALVCSLLGELVYSAFGPEGRALRPAALAVVQNLAFMLQFALRDTALVVAGALLAPRARLATAIVLAAMLVPLSLRNHVLSQPWWLWSGWVGNYTHFILEALGAVLGVVYIFCSEKALSKDRESVAGVPPGPAPP